VSATLDDAADPGDTPSTLGSDPNDEPTTRERAAAMVEDRLDIPMAILAVAWAGLIAYELVAPQRQSDELALAGNPCPRCGCSGWCEPCAPSGLCLPPGGGDTRCVLHRVPRRARHR
jgi:hypothetical protein